MRKKNGQMKSQGVISLRKEKKKAKDKERIIRKTSLNEEVLLYSSEEIQSEWVGKRVKTLYEKAIED